MITDACIDAYNEAFPDNVMKYYYQLGGLGIAMGAFTFYEPRKDETAEAFMDRLRRSKKQNKNLFLKEWKKVRVDPNAKY